MDAIYSEAFEHLSGPQVFRDDPNTDPEENIRPVLKKRSGLKKKSVLGSGKREPIENDSVGEYIDSSEINPRIPPHLQRGQSRTDECRFRTGHIEEESNEYQYAYSTGADIHMPPERRQQPVPQRSVSLKDDYSLPPDRLSKSSARPSSESQDYVEPYQSQGFNPPLAGPDPAGIYELAKDITPPPTQKTHPQRIEDLSHKQYSHIVSNTTKALQNTRINEDSDSEGYDHLDSWQKKRPDLRTSVGQMKKSADKIRQGSSTPDDFLLVKGDYNNPQQCMYEDIPSEYQDPWDTHQGQKKFSRLMERAEKTDERRRSEDQIPALKGKQIHQPSQGGANPQGHPSAPLDSNANVYELAWDPSKSNDSALNNPPSEDNKPAVPGQRNKRPVVANYEEAWDTEGKQKEFEEKLAAVRRQRLSEGKISSQDAPNVDGSVINNDDDTVFKRTKDEPPLVNMRTKGDPTPPSMPMPAPRQLEREFVSRSDSCKSLAALAEKVDKTIPLEEQSFYHGSIKRSEAERMLCVFKDGSYLIRRSESNRKDFSLTLKGWNGIPMHMKITCKRDGTYILGENSPPFHTIPEMVDYYTRHELPVQNAERICLLYPIPS